MKTHPNTPGTQAHTCGRTQAYTHTRLRYVTHACRQQHFITTRLCTDAQMEVHASPNLQLRAQAHQSARQHLSTGPREDPQGSKHPVEQRPGGGGPTQASKEVETAPQGSRLADQSRGGQQKRVEQGHPGWSSAPVNEPRGRRHRRLAREWPPSWSQAPGPRGQACGLTQRGPRGESLSPTDGLLRPPRAHRRLSF